MRGLVGTCANAYMEIFERSYITGWMLGRSYGFYWEMSSWSELAAAFGAYGYLQVFQGDINIPYLYGHSISATALSLLVF